MKQIKKAGIAAVMFTFCILFGMKGNVQAANKIISSPGVACKSGKYIYYAYEMSGVRMGIMRYDTTTKRKKQITGYTYKGQNTNGFYNISVKGKYVYATWDQEYGTAESRYYIYRINKNNGVKKKLASGKCPVVTEKYIYYISQKYDKSSISWETSICRMKLNGSSKKKMYTDDDIERLYTDGKKLYYSKYQSDFLYTLDGEEISRDAPDIVEDRYSDDMVTVGNYQYYKIALGNNWSLYRENINTGKKNLVARFPSISSWRVCGSYVMIKAYTNSNQRFDVYCVSASGKSKKKLASWRAAE